MTTPLLRNSGAPPVLTFYRPEGRGPFDDAEASIFAALLPHLRRAVRLRSTVSERLGPPVSLGPLLLERVSGSAMLLDAGGRMNHANTAARHMLDGGDLLHLRHGRLQAANRAQDTALHRLIGGSLARQARSGEMLLRRADLSYVLLSAAPVSSGSGREPGGSTVKAILVVTDPRASPMGLSRRLMQFFNLSSQEARVASALADGLSPSEIAVSHAVAISTVRTQIASIYGKLEVRREAELVRILMLVAGST